MTKYGMQKRLGIIGGGQLGKMMIQAASKWSIETLVLDPSPACPAAPLCNELIVSGFRNEKGLLELASKTDVLTCEFEHITTEGLNLLESQGYEVYPPSESLRIIQNKYHQKTVLKENHLPVGPFRLVESKDSLKSIGEELGYPLMLKSAMEAYDGKGNALASSLAEAKAAFDFLTQRSEMIYAEAYVAFEKELSILCCRDQQGQMVTYPPAENIHKDSILYQTIVPARLTREQVALAEEIAKKICVLFHGVGIFCVEMFLDGDGRLLVNEVAPRPHNSGHYTIEACVTSQFDNHVRAVLGLPLGSTKLLSPVVMRNLLGAPNYLGRPLVLGEEAAFALPGLNLHFYGKEETRPFRKMGHFTIVADTVEEALSLADQAEGVLQIVSEQNQSKI